jgi:hypothetical protein
MPRFPIAPATSRLLRVLGLPLSLSLAACREEAGKPQVTADVSALGADLDGDGFGDSVDCDDNDPLTYPGATEICDLKDNDCDAKIDEMGVVGTAFFYPDADGDGYGVRAGRVRTCFAPVGFSALNGDCDDTSDQSYPGATEVCDLQDNDCDGVADEPGTVGIKSWYADADADGQGNAAGTPTRACFAPPSTVNNKLDCDDADAAINTGATEICDLKDNDCDGKIDEAGSVGVTTYYADGDGDTYGNPTVRETACFPSAGYVNNRLDCDDTRAAVNPAATEACDGLDNDCDAKIDEPGATGELTFYRDADADGYGKPALTVQRCSAPSGYVSNATDCRDADPAVNPGATELCDGIDNNCDLVVDDVDTDTDGAIAAACGGPDCNDADANVGPGQTELWYDGVDQDCDGASDYDADLDGYDSLVSGGDDCDDTDATRSPAAIEVWYDGIDQDCDALSDYDADLDGQDSDLYAGTDCDDTRADVYDGATEIWYDGVDQNCLGDSDFDADQDGFEVDVDCEDEVALVNPLADEVCGDGYDNDCSGDHSGCAPYTADLVTLAEATWWGESAGDRAGQGDPGFDGVGDWNGDGIDDFAVGALRDDDGGTDAGAVYIVFGGALSGTDTLASADLKITGESAGDNFGRGVAGVGDVNGDGFADLLVGAIGVDVNGADSGAGYLFYGPASGTLSANASEAALYGEAAGEIAGEIAWVGDISGDGQDDLMIGAQYAGRGGTRRGAVYLFTTPPSGALTLSSAPLIISGDADNDELGASCWARATWTATASTIWRSPPGPTTRAASTPGRSTCSRAASPGTSTRATLRPSSTARAPAPTSATASASAPRAT